MHSLSIFMILVLLLTAGHALADVDENEQSIMLRLFDGEAILTLSKHLHGREVLRSQLPDYSLVPIVEKTKLWIAVSEKSGSYQLHHDGKTLEFIDVYNVLRNLYYIEKQPFHKASFGWYKYDKLTREVESVSWMLHPKSLK